MTDDTLTHDLQKIAAFGLVTRRDPSPLEFEASGWATFLSQLDWQRLTGFALASYQAGLLNLTDAQAGDLLDRHRATMMWALHLERVLLRLAGAFEGESIDSVVLKGPALANCIYPEPSWRPFGDLDLLVPARHWYRACGVLEREGYHRHLPEPRPGFSVRFGHTAMHRDAGGTEVDLHRTLVGGPFGLWMDPQALFGMTTPFCLGDQELQRLNATGAFLNACVHASLGFWPPLLVPLRDVAQIAHHADVDWEQVCELGAVWKLRGVLQHALRTASEALDTPIPQEAERLFRMTMSRRERRALAAYTSNRRERGGKALSNLAAIRGVRAKIAYVWALLIPSRAFLSTRGTEGAPGSYVGRWLVPLRWARAKVSGHRQVGGR